MKPFTVFCSLVCALLISQLTFAQPATFYRYLWSQDGSRLIVIAQNTTVIATVYDAQWQPLASRQLPCCGASLSRDGRFLLVSTEPSEIWDTDTLQTVRVFPVFLGTPAWSPDGTELAAAIPGPPGGMRVYSAADGRLLREFTSSNASAWGAPEFLARSPNWVYVAAGFSNQLALLDPITGQQIGANYQLDGDIYSLSWSLDSTKLAIGLRKQVATQIEGSFPVGDSAGSYALNSIVLFEISTGSIRTLRSGFQQPASLLRWSPDDQYIAASLDGNLYTMDSTNGNLIESFSVSPNFTLIGWSPNGGRLLMGLYNNLPYDPTLYDTSARSSFVQTELNGLIQMVVPAASPERLQAILAECSSDSPLQASADTLIDAGQYQQFITCLDANTSVPAACAADLRLMAQALQAQ
jgi:WD40 repeat protein